MTTPTPESIRILLVDDHRLVRLGLGAVLTTEPDLQIVAEAEDGRQAVDLFERHRPDVTLMDLRLPVLNGMEALRIILAAHDSARVLMLSTYDGDADIAKALKVGACGYLLKSTPPSEIIHAIRTAHAGLRFMPLDVARRLAEHAVAQPLTGRELDVLQLVVRGRSNKEIGATLNLTEGTVKIHLHHLFSKLNVFDRTQAAITALRRGLVHLD